jgi:hypothetical protein
MGFLYRQSEGEGFEFSEEIEILEKGADIHGFVCLDGE